VKPETKFWHEVKKSTPQISWTRLENLSSLGTPDLLGYNINGKFFTVELKVTKTNKIRLSPHQKAFHIKHPNNTFILIKALTGSRKGVKLYEGKNLMELDACGLKLEPLRQDLRACCSYLTWLEP
jgi:hypothetical protein|tara:strand:+ start:608 stop:982 length:375 start_codon:yes stop_codon:yes gene_type:complete